MTQAILGWWYLLRSVDWGALLRFAALCCIIFMVPESTSVAVLGAAAYLYFTGDK